METQYAHIMDIKTTKEKKYGKRWKERRGEGAQQ